MTPFFDSRDWFFRHRFGMFVHWGLYAINEWHEQEQWRRCVPRREYEKLKDRFNPVKFNPEAWLDCAQAAGMSYITFTTKHHDGFCLWNTKQTEFNVMNTPYGKDTLRMLADACHRRKMPLCLYHSVVDWHHPNYPAHSTHHEIPWIDSGDKPDAAAYIAYLKAQVRELCTEYGPIHGIWWDGDMQGYRDPSINAMIRELQPQAVINNRGFDPGDFGTPEREYDNETGGQRVYARPTEVCQSVGHQSWGYRADEEYYTSRYLIRQLDDALARGGNYLLNVGPTALGEIPPEASTLLKKIGSWWSKIHEAFDDATPASTMTENKNVFLTRRENTLYVHFPKDPSTSAVQLPGIQRIPKRASLLNTGVPLRAMMEVVPSRCFDKPCLEIRDLPAEAAADTVLVAKLEFDAP